MKQLVYAHLALARSREQHWLSTSAASPTRLHGATHLPSKQFSEQQSDELVQASPIALAKHAKRTVNGGRKMPGRTPMNLGGEASARSESDRLFTVYYSAAESGKRSVWARGGAAATARNVFDALPP